MANYLLDTNHASKIMANDQQLALRVVAARTTEAHFYISITVLAELYFAIYASRNQEENLRRLNDLLRWVLIWPFDEVAAVEFGKIQAELRAKGRPIRPMDAQIAAVARVRRAILLTADRHFQFVDELTVENWLGTG